MTTTFIICTITRPPQQRGKSISTNKKYHTIQMAFNPKNK
jgi:hypothetical protein